MLILTVTTNGETKDARTIKKALKQYNQWLKERRMDTPLIIYHGGCKDGFCAAWVAKTYFDSVGQETEFFAASYGKEPPDVNGRNVFVVDFSYPRPILEKMWKEAHVIRVLDHHKTAQADLAGLDFCTFDMNRSGAGMAWDYFHHGHPRPYIVNYVEDRDLWLFKLEHSKEVNAYLQNLPYEFEAWEAAGNMDLKQLVYLGTIMHKVATDKHNSNIDILMSRHLFHGYEQIPFINHPTEGISEVMHLMLDRTKAPFCVGWRLRDDNRLSLSFRSIPDFDCAAIAKIYGGGGHKNASGAELSGPSAVGFLVALLTEPEKK